MQIDTWDPITRMHPHVNLNNEFSVLDLPMNLKENLLNYCAGT